jgi:hypothetical protein
MKQLPPDAELIALAKVANAKLKPGAGVAFFRVKHDDDSTETRVVFECGVRRAVASAPNGLGLHDADELVRSVQAWANKAALPASKWTMDPQEAA